MLYQREADDLEVFDDDDDEFNQVDSVHERSQYLKLDH